MSKLTEIIRREIEGVVAKQSGLTVTPAKVTAVREDYLRADVKLMGNGAEIKAMLNKTAEKLTVGQTVTVAYSTLPSSGVILLANGEADLIKEGGGGVQVENAVLYDAANLHEYTVDNELMTDISANTKLYYGATDRMIVAQGMLFYQGSSTLSNDSFTNALDDLLTENSAYIAPEYRGIISYRYTNNVAYRLETDVKVYLEQVDYPDGNRNRARMWFKIAATTKETNLSTSVETTTTNTARVNFYTSNTSDITEYGLLLASTRFGEQSPVTELESYIPNGYVGFNSASSSAGVIAMLVYKNDNASVNKWNAGDNGGISPYSPQSYTTINVGALMPLSANETILALGATKRTEPQGGDD